MQPVVPYWRQPANMGVPVQPGGGFNAAQTVQTAAALYNIGQSIDQKQRVQRTKKFVAKQAQQGKPLRVQDIGDQDLDLPMFEKMVGLRESLRGVRRQDRLDLTLMSMEVFKDLATEEDPSARFAKAQMIGEQKNPGLMLAAQGLQALAVDEQGQPLMDAQGRPIIPDEVLQQAVSLADLELTAEKAAAIGISQRHTKWADKGPVAQVQELKDAFPRFGEWTAKELNYMQHGKIGTLPDGTLDLPNFELFKMTPKANTRERIKGLVGGGTQAGATPGGAAQPGAPATGTMPDEDATASGLLHREIETLTQQDFVNDPEGTRDLLLNYGMTKHEELQKEGVTGAVKLAGKHLGEDAMAAGNAIGEWLEDKAANIGDLAKGAIRALPGGGHLVGQESEIQPLKERDFVAEAPAAPSLARQPDPGEPDPREPRTRDLSRDPDPFSPHAMEYSMAIGRTPEEEETIRKNYFKGQEDAMRRMREQEEGEAAGREMDTLRDVERRTLDSLIQHEGFDETWRTDRHGEVIGHGLQRKNLEAMLAKTGEAMPEKVSRAQARRYTMQYVREVALPGARRAIGDLAWQKLSPVRKAVLVEMVFQIGEDGLDIGGRKPGFNRMIRAIRAGDFEAAARELVDSDLGRQTPGRAKALAQRLRKG